MRAGYPALVGERGPEILSPRHSGYVVPSGKSGGGTIVQHFDLRNSALTRDVVEMAARRGAALGQAQARDARVRGLEFA
jgi:phage-related minor tail protein